MRLIFDLDGVLLDSETDLSWYDRAVDRTLRAVGAPVTAENRRRLYWTNLDGFEEVAREFGLEPRELWAIRGEHYLEEKLSAIESGELRPFGDVEALYALAGSNDLHVISNSPQEVVDAFVETYGYDDLFGAAVGRGLEYESLDRLKPDRHLYDRLLERVGGPSPREVYAGDTQTDREFAEATGMEFVRVGRDGAEGVDLAALVERFREP